MGLSGIQTISVRRVMGPRKTGQGSLTPAVRFGGKLPNPAGLPFKVIKTVAPHAGRVLKPAAKAALQSPAVIGAVAGLTYAAAKRVAEHPQVGPVAKTAGEGVVKVYKTTQTVLNHPVYGPIVIIALELAVPGQLKTVKNIILLTQSHFKPPKP